MPIYEYQCPDCGHTFERMRKMSDDPLKDCPECSGTNVGKLLSAPAFHLKGGGWYSDHYGLKAGAKADSDSAGSPADSKSTDSPASSGSDTSSPASTGSGSGDSGSGSSGAAATTPKSSSSACGHDH